MAEDEGAPGYAEVYLHGPCTGRQRSGVAGAASCSATASGCGTCPHPVANSPDDGAAPSDCSGIGFSCHHLAEHLLAGELMPVGGARVLADGGDKLAELVVASDPELNPAGAAADVPG